jgi:hypothetical protein
MSDRDLKDSAENDPDGAPELLNDEQEDESSQAQTVADEAMDRNTSVLGLEDSEKFSTGDDSDDVQDLVDHMVQMETSGIIDMSAFRGERNDDEEEGRYGDAAEEE